MFYTILLFYLIIISPLPTKSENLLQSFTNNQVKKENILCRSCGCDISSSNHLVPKLSPVAKYVHNDTLFSKDNVVIQVLTSDYIFDVPVITSAYATCSVIGEWEEVSWFPGYHGKLCFCSNCGAYIGWSLEYIKPNFEHTPKQFFALILSNIIGETCKYFLTITWILHFVLPIH